MSKIVKKTKSKFKKYFKEFTSFIDEIDSHHIFLLSAGIAFNMILYIIPMFLLATYIMNKAFDINSVSIAIERVLTDYLPPVDSTRKVLASTLEELATISRNSSYAGWLGLATIIWFSSTLFSSVRTGLNAVYSIETPNIFLFYRIKDILFTIILSILLIFTTYAIPMTSFVESVAQSVIPGDAGKLFSQFTYTLLTLISSFAFFYFIYTFVPNKSIPNRARTISTIFCVVSIEVSRRLFAWYLSSVSNYGKVYGTYAVIVSLAIWVYYSAILILLSAELGRFFDSRRKKFIRTRLAKRI
ncbi:MAG: YihY/virulence factor BrkB family protein [Candidatus Kapabacteria bacterium]|nr:YihY/virulence factor BrkB family protein [Candidatus Kapabacteria bacterium]